MKRVTLVCVTFLLAFVGVGYGQQSALSPQADTDTGVVAGMRDSATGVTIFRGIPYAASPAGEWRWRPPRPSAKWAGVRQATEYGPICPQGSNASSEDCLSLNVWTPAMGATARQPVVVLFHGGGAALGSGAGPYEDLAKKGIVVVTMNYRLGLLGHLAHPALRDSRQASGNYALLDQIAALQWVQRNIAAFGGDRSRVTAAGGSAGAKSVATLVVSPLAKGLFHRAILQSGSGMDESVETLESGEARGVLMAKLLGVESTDAGAARALRAMPVDKILSMSASYRRDLVAGGEVAAQTSRSVVDGWAIPKPVDALLQSGAFHRVPIFIGTNADEGSPVVARDAKVDSLEAYRVTLERWHGDDDGVLLRAYPARDVAGIIPALERVYGDKVYGAPARAFARLASAHHVPVFFYFFTRVGEGAREPGAAHGSDGPFFLNQSTLSPQLGTTPYDGALRQAMSDYYVAFITSGDPNGPGRPQWPAYAPGSEIYLEFGRRIEAKRDLRKAEWDAQDHVARRRGAIRP